MAKRPTAKTKSGRKRGSTERDDGGRSTTKRAETRSRGTAGGGSRDSTRDARRGSTRKSTATSSGGRKGAAGTGGRGNGTTTRAERSHRSSGLATREGAERLPEFQPPPNDNISRAFDALGLVPAKYRGSDRFLDIVTWNIRFFHDQEPERVERIVDVLEGLNADIIVMQEIREGSLEVVAERLRELEAGYYATAYGTTGGDQRVAIMYDLDWIRAKDDIREIYGRGQVTAPDGKDVFPRLPLLGVFTGMAEGEPFDFQLLGLHLKSQRGGGEDQRRIAARELANWLEAEAPRVDADVILIGDWNQEPSAPAWEPLRELEEAGKAKFTSINNESEVSHLMYQSKTKYGSRLDLTALSMSAHEWMGEPPDVVEWASLDDLLASNPKATEIRQYISAIREDVSDHLPVVTRFYFTQPQDEEEA